MEGNNESDRYEHNIKEAQILRLVSVWEDCVRACVPVCADLYSTPNKVRKPCLYSIAH